ncbi:glycosyltransferase family 2 protein [Apibacter raozihei]|uniref:glycosyltransferase family 2 protein n=1 Tax=Apibacter raozihei TaxID=2500547 RepID=UPI000FE4241E|nr:glycosyltransferase family 2 protein [Apibacter raozihei]
MSSPLVSVIMAAYNAEKFISESIESVMNQSYTDWELIIINDGSSDSTKKIAESFCLIDSRIQLINNEQNMFVIKSRNLGIEKAKGKYIAILDSDDVALPERLEKQVNYMETHQDVFLLGGTVVFINEKNDFLFDYHYPTEWLDIKKGILKKNLMPHSASFFKNIGYRYREKMFYCEDYDFALNAASKNFIINNLNDKLIKYRTTQGSLSRQNNQLIQWLFLNKTREFYKERLKNKIDSYNTFNPEEFLNIYDLDYYINKQDLIKSFKISIYAKNLNDLTFLLKKYKKFHSSSLIYLFYYNISKNKNIFSFLNFLYSKI